AFARRNWNEAERFLTAAVANDRDGDDARMNLGRVYEVTNRFEEAAAVYAEIAERRPGAAEPLVRLGIVRYGQSLLDEAERAFAAALERDPQHHLAARNLGIIANAGGRYDAAVSVLESVLVAHPEDAEAWAALADSLRALRRLDEAALAARTACERDPGGAQALIVRGKVAYERAAFDEAEESLLAAATSAPERYEPPMNLSGLYHGLGRVDEAIALGARAVTLAPQHPQAHVNLGLSRLLRGEFADGFAELEWRLRDPRARERYRYLERLPLWNGEPLGGRRLLVAQEQGIGDFICWSRLVPELQARGATVALEVPPALAGLYRRFPGVDELIAGVCGDERVDGFAAHLPICSLPHVLGVEHPTSPGQVPYLAADAARVARFRDRFAALGDRLRVGIVWGGDPVHVLDRFRSCDITAFEALADLSGIAWVSLQKGPREVDLQRAPAAMEILPLGPELADFEDTAAAIAALDLVIAVDTSVAHLAGALGAPIWTLHGFGKYWLWGLDGAETPWYPTMRLFRQHRPNEWSGLFADLRTAMQERLRAERAPEGR
ncbi:MAG TPA: tetratricopeptide repeat protein, partial [Candidatus Acidoferrum sp.]|nr:tetratricopeptide repeat protein [Candidatus Acidoferrum sp.]